ncbi:UDP-N-acetylmuramoyl-tripeptide--D-alanyl-D-alanine ligase [Luteitalea sp. TBR-22]|uniref:UDP-N-acetylmuramoyl-tripeptide--D-alanyl-D- alanine ligase n=1 Tax=Luteitalea sp. TBR-22 TaxID=2802971 RepID=UPI001AFADEE0|nr:UDP-N-acetylmuramoyl-tripeptide--D-alanyl-D-alanine ligase [Luteitalea sp. TBR-22]BCS35661.1 UDP-N-acetylmuramoyl-tripeptide--D-alanyl-D-alanine ligase [Luteitalea sp. TBR-22]
MSGQSFTPTTGEMAQAFGGALRGDAGVALPTVSIDTRTVKAGDLFVAIKGPRFDGHAFVGEAIARGAAAVVVSDASAVEGVAVPAIVVDDTLRGLQDAARVIRRRAGSTVVAITGSAGKTTTKEITATLLSRRFTTFRNRGNLNNHIGLPLSLFELHDAPQFAVMELGMSGFGEIRRLVEISEPQVRVWTNVGEAHLGFFTSVEDIAVAKQEILEGASGSDVFVANAGDPRVSARMAGFPGRVISFGVDVPADVAVTDVRARGFDGSAATLSLRGERHPIETRLMGAANLANIAAGAAVALGAGLPAADIVAGIADLTPASHRGEVVRAPGGWVVIDDAYNSSPSALTTALRTLAATPGRHVAVLGEMLELGDFAEGYHAACGQVAAELGLAAIVAVGGAPARALADAARAAGAPVVHHVADSTAAADLARTLVREGDTVLVKGSRGIRMEVVVQALAGGGR